MRYNVHLMGTRVPDDAGGAKSDGTGLVVTGAGARSGVGVLDKAVAVLDAVAGAPGPCSLADLVAATGISRATAHRLAVALEAHRLLRRTDGGRFALGFGLLALGRAAADEWPLAEAARPALESLRDATGESVQLYVREGDHRVCLASLDSGHELRTIVAEGARLPLRRGSAGRLLAGERPAAGYAASAGERAPGVGSVSAPVVVDGEVVAAVGISGPLERLGEDPGPRYGPAVARAAHAVAAALAAPVGR
jgi:DNA-binding IclR family transcriptional regulator